MAKTARAANTVRFFLPLASIGKQAYHRSVRKSPLGASEKKGGPHTARHTFATILRAKGFSLERR